MLFQPAPRSHFFKRAAAFAAGIVASLARNRADATYLDGMRPSELEDLGLRRGDDGGYRFFK